MFVSPTAASKFNFVSPPVGVTANTPFSLTINALDSSNNLFPGYLGTVHFSSDDSAAILPANYTFTAADQGSHTFTGIQLATLGSHTIAVTDVFTPSITGTTPIQVSVVAIDHFQITNAPTNVLTGQAFVMTITAVDASNVAVPGYRGAVHFASTDANAALPADYTFTAADSGAHTFSNVALNTVGAPDHYCQRHDDARGQRQHPHQRQPDPGNAFFGACARDDPARHAVHVTVTARRLNNTVTGYTGTIHFTNRIAPEWLCLRTTRSRHRTRAFTFTTRRSCRRPALSLSLLSTRHIRP